MVGQVYEEVEAFKYLESLVGLVKADVLQRILEGSRVLGVVRGDLGGGTVSWGRENSVLAGHSPHSAESYRPMVLKLGVWGKQKDAA